MSEVPTVGPNWTRSHGHHWVIDYAMAGGIVARHCTICGASRTYDPERMDGTMETYLIYDADTNEVLATGLDKDTARAICIDEVSRSVDYSREG